MRKKVTLLLTLTMAHSSFSKEIYNSFWLGDTRSIFHTLKTYYKNTLRSARDKFKNKLPDYHDEQALRFIALVCIISYLIIKGYKAQKPPTPKIESYFRQIKTLQQDQNICGYRAVDFFIRNLKIHLNPELRSALEQSLRNAKAINAFVEEYRPHLVGQARQLHLSQRVNTLLDCPQFHTRPEPDDYEDWVAFYERKKDNPQLKPFTKEQLLHSKEFLRLYEKEVLGRHKDTEISFKDLTHFDPIQESGIYYEKLLEFYENKKTNPRFAQIPQEQLLHDPEFRKEYEIEVWGTHLDTTQDIHIEQLMQHMNDDQKDRLNNYCEQNNIPNFFLPKQEYDTQTQSHKGDIPTDYLLDPHQIRYLIEQCRANLLEQGIALPDIVVCSEFHELRDHLTTHREDLKKEGIYGFIIDTCSKPGTSLGSLPEKPKSYVGHWVAVVLETHCEDGKTKMLLTFGDSLNSNHLHDHLAEVFTTCLNLDVKDKIYDVGSST